MLLLDNVYIDEDVLEQQFVCNLDACKGACCVAGDGGAPLETSEAVALEELYPSIKPYLTKEGRAAIEAKGKAVQDEAGEWETPLLEGKGACAYAIFEGGIAKCGVERAWQDGKIEFQKPVSCHLYPIRARRKANIEYLQYERWDICNPACANGQKLGVSVAEFTKDAIIRKFGSAFYEKLMAYAEQTKQT